MTRHPTNEAYDRLAGIAYRCAYPGLNLEVIWEGPIDQPIFFLRAVSPSGTCNTTQQPHPWKGRKWRLSKHMTDGEVVWTAFKAILTCLEHEARELFKFDGVAVADSHVDIHKLVALMKDPENRAERAHPETTWMGRPWSSLTPDERQEALRAIHHP